MKLDIAYLKKAEKFFAKNSVLTKKKSTQLVTKAIRKIILKEVVNIDLKKLKGNLKNYYRIRHRDIRILFELVNGEVVVKAIVSDIDYRGSIY